MDDSSVSVAETTNSDERRFGWKRFRFVVAAVLLAAAVVKLFTLPEIIAGRGLLATKLRLVSVVGFETAAATFLIVGSRFWSWLLALATFTVFVGAAVYALATDQPCQCFGKRFDPETMVIFDIFVLLLTAFSRPREVEPASRGAAWQLSLAVIAGGAVAAFATIQYDTVLQSEDARLLLWEERMGKPWPLNSHMHPKLSALETGRWMVLIVKRECSHCREMIETHFSDPTAHRPGERTAIFVPVGGGDRWQFQFDRVSFDLSGSDFISWTKGKPIVTNPAVFTLVDGVVKDAADGDKSDFFIRRVWDSNE